MFGYVRPVLNRLSVEQRDDYQSAYCGLCHAMGCRHGWLSRFTLNYDFAFLAILLSALSGEESDVCLRCPAHPLKKPGRCLRGVRLDTAADESMILTWHKLSDDVADHGFVTGLPYRFLRRLYTRPYQRAAKARPAFDRRVRDGLDRLGQLERERSPELDRVADSFASILSAAAEDCCVGQSDKRVIEQLFYHLGRWIYIVDAWDDLEEDRKKGRYNALDARFQGQAREQRAYVETTVTHSARLAGNAANLLGLGRWAPIVNNVMYFGLPAVQSAVLDGRWKELRRQGRKNLHERSV